MARSTAVAAVALVFFLLFAATASAALPTITYTIDGIAGSNGWYRGSANGDNVLLHWSVLDATWTDCNVVVTVPGDTTSTKESCSASNADGEITATTYGIKIDATPPTGVSASLSRGPDHNGWYNHPVTITWSGTDATSGIAACSSMTYQGPANRAAILNGSCTDKAGNSAAHTGVLAYDATPPTGVSASFSRKPDHNGWYNHPVTITWSGTDATSGIAACSSVTYQGPATGAAAVNGSCTDKAGNSAGYTARLAYDATPPVLGAVRERSRATADVLRWISSSASDRVVVRRAVRGRTGQTTVFDGSAAMFSDTTVRPDAEYLYSVQSFDQAGNASNVVSIVALPKVLTLHKMPYVPLASPNPILRWRPVRRAAYYNVQLFRGSKRIYAAWPAKPQTGLPTTWKWSGHDFRLTPGRYRWYVWAGFGSRKLAHYHSVGSATFLVPRG